MASLGKAWQAVDVAAALRRVLSGGPVYLFFLFLFVALLLTGAGAGVHALFVAGSRHAYGTYRQVPVAMLISSYAFFAIASTGICIISSIGHVFGVRDLMPLAKRCVLLSIFTILSGFFVIGLELENPIRMAIYNVISPNLSSNIWWMGTLYGFEVVFLTVEFIFLMSGDHRTASKVGLVGVICGVAAISNLGGVFAMMHGREFWYGPFLPVFFIASAMMTGCAFIMFFTIIASFVGRKKIEGATARSLEVVSNLAMLMIAVALFFTIWRMVSLSVAGERQLLELEAMVSGAFAFNFWGLEIVCGIVIPFILLWLGKGRSMWLMFTASALVIFSVFFVRLDLVVIGQIVPYYMDLGVVEYSRLNAYMPTLHEGLVVLGGIGFCMSAFLFAERLFDGYPDDGHDDAVSHEAAGDRAEVAS